MITFEQFLIESEEADKWLEKYTYENLDKWPSKEILDDLLSDYPYTDNKPVYRGLNFEDEEQYNNFLKETENGTKLIAGGITSWSKFKNEARTFAVTRPTYFLNSELMQAVSIKSKNRDYMIGHAGVILEILPKKNKAIDVTKSKSSKESEVILIPGEYKIKIIENLIPFQKGITEENYQTIIKEIQKLDINDLSVKKLKHILFRFSKFDDETKEKLWSLLNFNPEIKNDIIIERVKKYALEFKEDGYQYNISAGFIIPDYTFLLYNFLLPKHQKIIRDFINKNLRQLKIKLNEKLKNNKDIDFNNINYNISENIILGQRLTNNYIFSEINKKLGDEYKKLNSYENIKLINSLKGKEQKDAINKMSQDIIKIIKNIK